MPTNSVHRLIGRALTDRRFREDLLQRPNLAIKDYPLSQLEQSYIISLHAMSLEEFSRKLSERLMYPTDTGTARRFEN